MTFQTPKTGDCVVIDSSFFVLITGGSYKDQCLQILKDLSDKNVALIIPQIVVCEMLRSSLDITVYKETLKHIEDAFIVIPTDDEFMESACKLHALHCWNETTKSKMQNRNIFNDLLVGTVAAHVERDLGVKGYVLAEDTDFMSPYFLEDSYVPLESQDGKSRRFVHLYKPNRVQANEDWKKYETISDVCTREKTKVWTAALKAAGIKRPASAKPAEANKA